MNQLEAPELMDAASVLDLLSELVNRFCVCDHVITYCNAAWAEQYGAERQSVIGRCLDDFLSPDELDGLRTQLDQLGSDRPVIVDPVVRSVPGDSERWLAWVDRYVVTENGPEVLSVGRDATDRHLAELGLRESEDRFRSLADNASDIVWRIRFEPSVHFDYVSPSVEHILGYPPLFFLNEFERILDISEPDTRSLIRGSLRGERLPERLDLRFRHSDGSTVVGETSITMDRTSIHGVIRDITELRRLQAITTAQALRTPSPASRTGADSINCSTVSSNEPHSRAPRSRSHTSTSTDSSRSTTNTVTPPVTSCCKRQRAASNEALIGPRCSHGSAATSTRSFSNPQPSRRASCGGGSACSSPHRSSSPTHSRSDAQQASASQTHHISGPQRQRPRRRCRPRHVRRQTPSATGLTRLASTHGSDEPCVSACCGFCWASARANGCSPTT